MKTESPTGQISRYRYASILLKELVRTDFIIRYQGSILGYLWALLRPLFLFIILYIVFVYFLHIGKNIPHWPIAMLLGIVLWNFFTEITSRGLKAVVNNGGLIRKINFPKYVLLLAVSISALINLSINLSLVVLFMIINQVDFRLTILWTPLFILELLIFAVGLSLILSTIYVKYRDVSYIWEIFTQALFYGSAILFPISIILERSSSLAQILLLNPIAQSIQDARNVAISTELPTLYGISNHNILLCLIPIVIVIGTLLIGLLIFKKGAPNFAEDA